MNEWLKNKNWIAFMIDLDAIYRHNLPKEVIVDDEIIWLATEWT